MPVPLRVILVEMLPQFVPLGLEGVSKVLARQPTLAGLEAAPPPQAWPLLLSTTDSPALLSRSRAQGHPWLNWGLTLESPARASLAISVAAQAAAASLRISKPRSEWRAWAYRVEEDHPLVHDLEVVGKVEEVSLELVDQVRDLVALYLDDEGVGQLQVLGRNHQVVLLRDQDFNVVHSVSELVPQLMFLSVKLAGEVSGAASARDW